MKRIKQRDCLNCGKEVSRKPKKYCNNSCQRDYDYKQYIERWKGGLEDGMKGGYDISNHIKRFLFEKYDSKCCECSWNKKHESDDKVPLEVHHKDGDFRNNVEDNFQLLCPNCHSLTFNYKNRSNTGRKDRKKYYKPG